MVYAKLLRPNEEDERDDNVTGSDVFFNRTNEKYGRLFGWIVFHYRRHVMSMSSLSSDRDTYNDGGTSKKKYKLHYWPLALIVVSFTLFYANQLLLPILLSTFPSSPSSSSAKSSDAFNFSRQTNNNNGTIIALLPNESHNQEKEQSFPIDSLLYNSSYCQEFYLKNEPDSSFVCWWLHTPAEQVDTDGMPPLDKSALKQQWLSVTVTNKDADDDDHSPQSQQRLFMSLLRKQALNFYFRPRLSPEQRRWLWNLTSMCLSLVENHIDAPHFLFAGSLVGYLRHNGTIIPWDDDIDVGLIVKRPDQIHVFVEILRKKAIEEFAGAISIAFIPALKRVKCFGYDPASVPIEDYEWRFPFVDIQFMRIRRSGLFRVTKYIQDMDLNYENYSFDDVFPLQRVNFTEGNIRAFIPKDPVKATAVNFRNINQCVSPGYSHRLERPYTHTVQTNCADLTAIR